MANALSKPKHPLLAMLHPSPKLSRGGSAWGGGVGSIRNRGGPARIPCGGSPPPAALPSCVAIPPPPGGPPAPAGAAGVRGSTPCLSSILSSQDPETCSILKKDISTPRKQPRQAAQRSWQVVQRQRSRWCAYFTFNTSEYDLRLVTNLECHNLEIFINL